MLKVITAELISQVKKSSPSTRPSPKEAVKTVLAQAELLCADWV